MDSAKSYPRLKLDDDQKFALMKFRRNVRDILRPEYNDAYLCRWLRARSWNGDEAEKMFRKSMQWRKDWGVDDKLLTWEAPPVIQQFLPSGISGFDSDGCPVYIVPLKGFDVVGMLHSTTQQDLIRRTIQILENVLKLAAENGQTEATCIFDLEDLNIRQYAWRPAFELVITLLQMYEANYPEILRVAYIINAPRLFAIAFNIIKKFLAEYTISKIKIFKSDPTKWKKAILSQVPPDQLPAHYGGTMTDPDGDPKCPSKIKPGGQVPKSFYSQKEIDDTDTKFLSTTVKKGTKFTLDFMVTEENCMLRWDFNTETHDIRFGVFCKDEEGNTHNPIPVSRVNSNELDIVGVLQCQAPATYTVVFDNSHSKFKNKKLKYNIRVTDPLDSYEIKLDQ